MPQVARHAESTGDRGVRVAVAIALQRQRGGGFDRLTKTRTAAKLLQVLWDCITDAVANVRHTPSKQAAPSMVLLRYLRGSVLGEKC